MHRSGYGDTVGSVLGLSNSEGVGKQIKLFHLQSNVDPFFLCIVAAICL